MRWRSYLQAFPDGPPMLGGCCGRRWRYRPLRHRRLRWQRRGRRRTRLLHEKKVELHQSPLSRELWPLEIFGGELPAVRRFELNLEGHDSVLDICNFFSLVSLRCFCGSCSGLTGCRVRADVLDTIEILLHLLGHRMRHCHVCRCSLCWRCGRGQRCVAH